MILDWRAEGAGPPVLLLHPVGLDLDWWDEVAARLAGSHSVVRPSAPGHGASPAADGALDLALLADTIVEGMTERVQAPFSVVGISFGGMLAQLIAIRHPGKVDRLVLSATAAGVPAPFRHLLVERGQIAVDKGMAAICDETLARWFGDAPLRPALVRRAHETLLALPPSTWAETWRAMANFDVEDQLDMIGAPTLVIHCEDDRSSTLAAAEALQRGIPRSRLHCLAGAGHLAAFDDPARFTSLVEEHLCDRA